MKNFLFSPHIIHQLTIINFDCRDRVYLFHLNDFSSRLALCFDLTVFHLRM